MEKVTERRIRRNTVEDGVHVVEWEQDVDLLGQRDLRLTPPEGVTYDPARDPTTVAVDFGPAATPQATYHVAEQTPTEIVVRFGPEIQEYWTGTVAVTMHVPVSDSVVEKWTGAQTFAASDDDGGDDTASDDTADAVWAERPRVSEDGEMAASPLADETTTVYWYPDADGPDGQEFQTVTELGARSIRGYIGEYLDPHTEDPDAFPVPDHDAVAWRRVTTQTLGQLNALARKTGARKPDSHTITAWTLAWLAEQIGASRDHVGEVPLEQVIAGVERARDDATAALRLNAAVRRVDADPTESLHPDVAYEFTRLYAPDYDAGPVLDEAAAISPPSENDYVAASDDAETTTTETETETTPMSEFDITDYTETDTITRTTSDTTSVPATVDADGEVLEEQTQAVTIAEEVPVIAGGCQSAMACGDDPLPVEAAIPVIAGVTADGRGRDVQAWCPYCARSVYGDDAVEGETDLALPHTPPVGSLPFYRRVAARAPVVGAFVAALAAVLGAFADVARDVWAIVPSAPAIRAVVGEILYPSWPTGAGLTAAVWVAAAVAFASLGAHVAMGAVLGLAVVDFVAALRS